MATDSSNVAGGHLCIKCSLDQSEDRQTDRQADSTGQADRLTKDRQTDRSGRSGSGSSYLKDIYGGLVDGAHHCTARIDRVTHCPHDDSSSSGVQPYAMPDYVIPG